MSDNRGKRYRIVIVAAIVVLSSVAAVASYRHWHQASESRQPALSSAPAAADMAGMNMSGDGSVAITPKQIAQFGVTFGTVERRMLTNDVRTVGTVMVDESRTTSVTSKIGGYVERLYINSTGEPVRAGQAVAEVYSPDLIAAQEDLLLARRLERTIGASTVPGVPSSSGELLNAAKRRLR
ncbi:MAG: efflux RND transporter periplasmic adaptor subunit, partial [Gemmatimonadaceae bacterium]